MVWPIIGGIAMGAISAVTGSSAQSSARAAEQRRIENQYRYDTKNWRFNWRNAKRDYNYRLEETGVARSNQEQNLRYMEQTALRDYQYNLAIRDYDYKNQLRQYNESERIYGLQLGFNNQAAQMAMANEERRFNEIMTGMAFEQQDMLVKMLQEEGEIQARGQSGRSAAKSVGAALASYGRNQAVLAESLLSAQRESSATKRQIGLDKYGADLNAQSRRMLKPLLAPAPMAPLKMPRATILDPLKPKKPPKPIKGTNTMPSTSGLSIASSFISSGLDAYKSFGGKF
jgi:hypothetical protein